VLRSSTLKCCLVRDSLLHEPSPLHELLPLYELLQPATLILRCDKVLLCDMLRGDAIEKRLAVIF
jgi:hypothetical protein